MVELAFTGIQISFTHKPNTNQTQTKHNLLQRLAFVSFKSKQTQANPSNPNNLNPVKSSISQ